MAIEIFKFRWFQGSQKLFFTIKLLIKLDRQKKQENSAHGFGDNYLTNHLVKFLQDRIKPWRVGALRVCTGSQSYSGCASTVIFTDVGQKGPPR